MGNESNDRMLLIAARTTGNVSALVKYAYIRRAFDLGLSHARLMGGNAEQEYIVQWNSAADSRRREQQERADRQPNTPEKLAKENRGARSSTQLLVIGKRQEFVVFFKTVQGWPKR